MLRSLSIKNIALIDQIQVDFSEGFNILTGETGAGKSIIIDSINTLLGSRVSKDLIRTGQESAVVEALFDIEGNVALEIFKEQGFVEDDNQIVVSREFNLQGKNICRINGHLVNVSMLKELGQNLIDIHGQHDNQSLLNFNVHIDLLDKFGGDKVSKSFDEYYENYQAIKEIRKKIEQLGGDSRERERKLDLLKFQIEEIDTLKLKSGEDKELEEQKIIMSNAEKMVSSVEESYNILYEGGRGQSILDGLNLVLKELGSIERFDSKVSSYIEKVQSIYYSAEDIVHEIRDYKASLEFDSRELENIEERLDNIFKLKRKYGQSIEEILAYRDEVEKELLELEGSQEKLDEYNKKLEELNNLMNQKAEALSKLRKSAAVELEQRIIAELNDLEMKKVLFKVNFEKVEYTAKGIDKIEFLISANAGEDLKQLSKIASGGEMSRIMLAIKTILADVDQIPTLIFDEVDTGVSGKAAQMVGQKLSLIAKNHQVLCITHLPQIASMSDNHYLIEKNVEGNKTKTSIRRLDNEGKMHEVARILGGMKITDTTLLHAQEMIEDAKERKKA